VKRFALCYQTVVCLSVCLSVGVSCNVGILWPNGWMDQVATWYGGRPQPRPHCFRWGPSSPKSGTAVHQFSAHVYCSQTAEWIRIPLGTEVGLGPGDIVLNGDSAPPRKGAQQAPIFGPCYTVAKRSPISACSCSALVLTANCPNYMLHEISVQATHYGSCAGLTDVGHVR